MAERVLVVGLGRSGRAIARLLRDRGREVVITDAAMARTDVPHDLRDLEWAGQQPTDAAIDGVDALVLSPGVDPRQPFIERARAGGKRVSGEVEEAFSLSDVPVIAVTGTNGKSTTTMLVAWLLECSALRAPAGGNLGTPYAELVALHPRADYHVVEVSSFQAETLQGFRPHVGVFLNLTADHLARHGDMATYGAAKRRVFEAQTADDWLVTAPDASALKPEGLAARRATFGATGGVGAWVADDDILVRGPDGVVRPVAHVADVPLAGHHHVKNVLAAVSVLACLERPLSSVADSLRRFRGLAHRMEAVGTLAGMACFDDSKATNVDAAVAGVGGLDRPVLLICGGQDDGQEFDRLATLTGVKAACGIGPAGARVAEAFGDRGVDAGTMRAAVTAAAERGDPGDVIVLSPGCKSFDHYRDFAERGRHFQRLVAELESEREAKPVRESVHFVGIGGAGMSALAEVEARRGAIVTGSDQEDGPALSRLRRCGVVVHLGHDAAFVGAARRVVVSSAIPGDNPEVREANRRGIEVIHRATLLAEMLEGRKSIAVTGSHGKTTTTALIASALKATGGDPLALVGGDLLSEGTNVLVGDGRVAVCEADESDGSFAVLRPDVVVLTNLDGDHLDHYGSMAGLVDAFRRWIDALGEEVTYCIGDDDPVVRELVRGRRVVVCGSGDDADVRVDERLVHTRGTRVAVEFEGESVSLALPLLGSHNVQNAAVAIGALLAADVPLRAAAEALSSFRGVARRYEVKGEARGVLVVEDYAHHPAEIAAVLQAVRRHVSRRVRVVFQPHRHTRTRALEHEFAVALSRAHDVTVTGVYGADENAPADGWDHEIASRINAIGRASARRIDRFDDVVDSIARAACPGDVVLLLSAGDLPAAVAGKLLDRFRRGTMELWRNDAR